MSNTISLRRPDDFHIHFRQEPQMHYYVQDAADLFGRVLVMPNTVPPVDSPARILAYSDDIRNAAPGYPHFRPLLAFKLTQQTDSSSVGAAMRAGAVAAKLYPEGATTNSDNAVSEIDELYPVFGALQSEGMVLCIHAEDPKAFVTDREAAFIPTVAEIHRRFPDLRIVLEHVSTAAGVGFVLESGPTVAATITAHHLSLTLDDVLGAGIRPHYYCKPLLGRREDRDALIAAAVGGEAKFFFGSDSAPHLRRDKEGAHGAAGIYSSPTALSVLAELFERVCGSGWVERLEAFTSVHGAAFYGLPVNDSYIELAVDPWTVPGEYHGVVPLRAGDTLRWRATGSPRLR
jgi:dihydroorotase